MSDPAKDIAKLATRGWTSLNGFAKIIGVTYPTALAMRNRGQVNCVQVGGVFRVYDDEVKRFLHQGNSQLADEELGEVNISAQGVHFSAPPNDKESSDE